MGFVAPFPLCPAFPIEAYAVVTRLALPFTVVAFWSFFSALDLPILARPITFSHGRCDVGFFPTYQQPLRLRFLGSALPGFLGRGMAIEGWQRKLVEALGCCSSKFELVWVNALGEGFKAAESCYRWGQGQGVRKFAAARRRVRGAFLFHGHTRYKQIGSRKVRSSSSSSPW